MKEKDDHMFVYERAIREGFELAARFALFDCGDEIEARRCLEKKILANMKKQNRERLNVGTLESAEPAADSIKIEALVPQQVATFLQGIQDYTGTDLGTVITNLCLTSQEVARFTNALGLTNSSDAPQSRNDAPPL